MIFIFKWLLLTVMLMHIIVCPFTKVEESFNIQATHDIIYNTFNLSKFDHLEFPGVVPRSFIGPLILAIISWPLTTLADVYHGYKLLSQIIVRSMLGILVLSSFFKYIEEISKRFGKGVGIWTILLSLFQFHFLFYSSRTLPNMFALIFVLRALAYWIKGEPRNFIRYSAFVILVFRSELCVLLGLILLIELLNRKITIKDALIESILAGIVSLALTFGIDSFYWRRPVWPEGEVLWFNTVLNKSSDWGTQPLDWYFVSVLPRVMGSTLIFIPYSLWISRPIRPIFIVSIFFVLIYSFLPHKELRFIIYVFPMLNSVAAYAFNRIWSTRKINIQRRLLSLIIIGHIILTTFYSFLLLFISSQNYPGGKAFQKLHSIVNCTNEVSIHIDVAAAQTGVTRFLETEINWKYDKREDLKMNSTNYIAYDYMLMDFQEYRKDLFIQNNFAIVEIVRGFSGLEHSSVFPFLNLVLKRKILILSRRENKEVNQTGFEIH